MHLSENEGIEGNIFVVTGGLGFVGSLLCLELVRRGAREVRSFDLRSVSTWAEELKKNGVKCIKGDVRKLKDVKKVLCGADCVFHLASYGMSGKEMLQVGRVDEVNINGTCNIIDSCIEYGIKRLVYLSTYNVVFGGKEIINGNESLPYFPIDNQVDPYSRSKSIAEQFVLKNNNRQTKKKGALLHTCTLRSAAIYGPGEERHLPRIVSLAKLGLLVFKIGDANVKTDWIYVDNLILALLLASMGLLDTIPGRTGCPVASGQSYFVSDGSPMNSFEFLKPILNTLGYKEPKIALSLPQGLFLGRIFWSVYTLLYPWLDSSWLPHPLILPAEVYKVGVTHYFSPLKAKEELGYIPMVNPQEGMAATISYWKDKKRRDLDGPTLLTWLLVTVGMILTFCVAFIPKLGPLECIRSLALSVYRSISMIRIVFILSAVAHMSEAIYAWNLAKRVDPANSTGWFWQTVALGFFSLRYLLKRAKTELHSGK